MTRDEIKSKLDEFSDKFKLTEWLPDALQSIFFLTRITTPITRLSFKIDPIALEIDAL